MAPEAERKALSEGLAQLHENMTTLSELALVAVRTAIHNVTEGDAQKASEVLTLDQEIFGLKQEITKKCVDLIALFAPVARDLRTITASLEITVDLDRIGRYSKDIAETAGALDAKGRTAARRFDRLAKMGDLTIRMIERAAEAFLHRDAEPVRNIVNEDDAIDELHEQLFKEIVDRMGDRSLLPAYGAELILINRYMERLADHAVNIGDHVAYMVTGLRLTHLERSRPRA
jgi:phosphate transport system protein